MDFNKLRISLMLLIWVLTFGTLSFYFVEHMQIFEAFYMTIITISTVGFSEIKPLSPYGRIIAIIIISTGITIGAYTVSMMVRVIIEGELTKSFRRKKVEKQISRLSKFRLSACIKDRILDFFVL